MSPTEKNIVEQDIKGINLRLLWALVASVVIGVATVLSVYYGIQNRLNMVEYRLMEIEKKLK